MTDERLREKSRGTICKCGLAESYHRPGRLAKDHEYEPRYPARRAATPKPHDNCSCGHLNDDHVFYCPADDCTER